MFESEVRNEGAKADLKPLMFTSHFSLMLSSQVSVSCNEAHTGIVLVQASRNWV